MRCFCIVGTVIHCRTVEGGTQYHEGVQYREGMFSTVRGYHEYRGGDILSTLGTVGDIMKNVGDILSTVGHIIMYVGDNMSTVVVT